jgi:hypothetical protein
VDDLKRTIARGFAFTRITRNAAHGELAFGRFAALSGDAAGGIELSKVPLPAKFMIDF